MLSVNINVLREAESDLIRESTKMKEIECLLHVLQVELSAQGDKAFTRHALSVKQLRKELDQEISDMDVIKRSLVSIEQAYSDCEKKNVSLDGQNGDTSYPFGRSENPWKLIHSAVYSGRKIPFSSYEADEVNHAYGDFIQPLLGDAMG